MSAELAGPADVPDRIALEHAALADALPGLVASREARGEALRAFARAGIPTQRDDVWKYANLRGLEHARFAPGESALSIEEIRAALPAPIEGFARYVFVDGRCVAELAPTLPEDSCSVHSVRDRRPLPVRDMNASADQRFAWLNDAFATDVASIGVLPDLEMPVCFELVFLATSTARQGASYPRIDVHVGEGSELCLIERHLSAQGGENLVDSSVQVRLEGNAQCRHYRIQQLGDGAIWLDTLDAVVGEEAEYQLHQLALGAESSRSTLAIELAGERAQLTFDAVALASNGQVQDTYAVVEHAAAHTTTRERFRGIAGARSRAAFNGKIVVARDARGADSHQSLRGLISGAQAEIDVRPQLEIYTDDVKCAHGATVGKLDDTMLFYLLSRGLDPETAHRLLKRAFIADVIAKIKVDALRGELEAALEGKVE